MPRVFILGGPNGAGKSTAASVLLPEFVQVRHFVNADEIARGLSGFDPESVAVEAGRIMLGRLKALAEERADFAFETTLASRSFAPWLRTLQERGYRVHLIYLWVPSASLSVQRVAQRKAAGGHMVPPEIVRRRFERSRVNLLELYLPLADTWEVLDNSQARAVPIAFGARETMTTVLDPSRWQAILGEDK